MTLMLHGIILDFRLNIQADIKSKTAVTSRCTRVLFYFRLKRSVKADNMDDFAKSSIYSFYLRLRLMSNLKLW